MASDNSLRFQIINLLAEEVGILAEIIFDEVLEEMGIVDAELSRVWAGKFIRVLDKKLPEDISQRQHIMREIGALLIKT